MSTPERAGWYDDPEDESRLRYFDGIIWSDRTVPRAAPTRAPEPVEQHASGQPSPGTDVFGRPTAATYPQPPAPQQTQYPAAPYAQSARPAEPTTADGQVLASYGARAGAYIIDGLIVMLLNMLCAGWAWWLWMQDYFVFVWDAAQANDPERIESLTPEQLLGMLDWKFYVIGLGLSLLVLAIYNIGFLVARSATPGKMVLGLSVRRVEHPGRLGVGTAFMRSLLPLGVGVLSAIPLVSYLIFFVTLADLVWPLRNEQRQALHDRIAGTQVVIGPQPSRRASQES